MLSGGLREKQSSSEDRVCDARRVTKRAQPYWDLPYNVLASSKKKTLRNMSRVCRVSEGNPSSRPTSLVSRPLRRCRWIARDPWSCRLRSRSLPAESPPPPRSPSKSAKPSMRGSPNAAMRRCLRVRPPSSHLAPSGSCWSRGTACCSRACWASPTRATTRRTSSTLSLIHI